MSDDAMTISSTAVVEQSVDDNIQHDSKRTIDENTVIKVLLVDDHAVVRDGIRARLEKQPHFVVVGEAINGRDAVMKAGELKPDIVLMDISMPVMNGMDASKQIRDNYPDIKVIILTMHEHKEYIQGVIRCGAQGYIIKDVSESEMISAIKSVWQGDTYYSSCVSQMMFDDFARASTGSNVDKLGLTQRQRTILALVDQGMSSKDIANELNISVRTVEAHRHNIKIKLDAQNSAHIK